MIKLATTKMNALLFNLERIAGTAGNGDLRSEILSANDVLDRLERGDATGVELAAMEMANYVHLVTGFVSPEEALTITRAQLGLDAL